MVWEASLTSHAGRADGAELGRTLEIERDHQTLTQQSHQWPE